MPKTAVSQNEWIRRFDEAPVAEVRLVCLPHAGGSAPFFRPLSTALSPGVEVLCVQYPGRQDRRHEPPIGDIGLLADRITEVLRPWVTKPLALFGHSMGATLGFEVARRLERLGAAGPVALFCSGQSAPSIARRDRVHLRDDSGLLEEVRALSGTDLRVLADDEMVRMVLPAIRSDYRAIETYTWSAEMPALGCAITALAGEADPRVPVAGVEAWHEHTTGDFTLCMFKGGHFFLSDHWRAIAELIVSRLGRDIASRDIASRDIASRDIAS